MVFIVSVTNRGATLCFELAKAPQTTQDLATTTGDAASPISKAKKNRRDPESNTERKATPGGEREGGGAARAEAVQSDENDEEVRQKTVHRRSEEHGDVASRKRGRICGTGRNGPRRKDRAKGEE